VANSESQAKKVLKQIAYSSLNWVGYFSHMSQARQLILQWLRVWYCKHCLTPLFRFQNFL